MTSTYHAKGQGNARIQHFSGTPHGPFYSLAGPLCKGESDAKVEIFRDPARANLGKEHGAAREEFDHTKRALWNELRCC